MKKRIALLASTGVSSWGAEMPAPKPIDRTVSLVNPGGDWSNRTAEQIVTDINVSFGKLFSPVHR